MMDALQHDADARARKVKKRVLMVVTFILAVAAICLLIYGNSRTDDTIRIVVFWIVAVLVIALGVTASQLELIKKRFPGKNNEDSVEYQSLLLSRVKVFPHIYMSMCLMYLSTIMLPDVGAVRIACGMLFAYAMFAFAISQFIARNAVGADTSL